MTDESYDASSEACFPYENVLLSPVSPPDPSLVEALQQQLQNESQEKEEEEDCNFTNSNGGKQLIVQRGFVPKYSSSDPIKDYHDKVGSVRNWHNWPPHQVSSEFLPEGMKHMGEGWGKDFMDMGGFVD